MAARPAKRPHDDLAAADEYNFTSEAHPTSLIEGLNSLRGDAVFCDVTLRIGERTFPAHRCVLATFSPFFKAMFLSQLKESNDREVTLKDLEPPMMETLLQFFYTGSVSITQANVQSLMAASNLLQVLPVFDACSLFMEKHMDAANCLGVHSFAETMSCKWLQEEAKEFALSHSLDVADHDEFLNLPLAKLVELVSSDALDVPREEDVFRAVLKWFHHQPDDTKEEFHKVLEHVRLPLLSPYFLHDCVATEPVMQSSPQCRALLEEARLYHQLPDRRHTLRGARTRPRSSAGAVEVIVCAGGKDKEKVFRSVKAFEPSSGRWFSLCNLPVDGLRWHAAAATGRNVLYVAGGTARELVAPASQPTWPHFGGQAPFGSHSTTSTARDVASRRLLRLDPRVSKWEERAPLSSPRTEMGMAVLDGFVYVAGGWIDKARLDLFERYNTETNTWETLPALKEAVSYPSLAAYDGSLFLVGGNREGTGAAGVQRFDPRSLSWTELAPPPSYRPYASCCLLDGRIYVLGGKSSISKQATNRVECYDIRQDRWSDCSPMRIQRRAPSAVALGGHLYVLGGQDERGEYPATVERYTPATDRWEDVTELSEPRWGMACAVIQVRESSLTGGK